MVEIVKQLNINRHPRDCVNFSLINAGNIKLTHDKHSITNEEGIINNSVIATAIGNNNIIGIIPTSTELVIFTSNNKIYRYNEAANTCTLANSKWKWSGGKIKGAYTTNVHNNLIIAIAEYDTHPLWSGTSEYTGDVPLKIINLDDNNDIFPAHELSYAVSPIVPYCYCSKFDYVDGYTYKGYYEFYIRYKISNNNYTQWFLINGKPLVDVTEFKDISTFVHPDLLTPDILNQGEDSYNYVTNGHADFVSDDSDFCKVALECTLGFSTPGYCPSYTKYQLAYIVSSKTYNKCYKTNDIPITTTKYIVNPKAEVEYSTDDLVTDYYNYYNVKQITNYKNRIYIADYKEHSLNPQNVNSFLNNLTISGEEIDATGASGGGGSSIITTIDNFYFNYYGDESIGKLSKNYVPNTAYGALTEITYDGSTYILFPLKYVVGDNGSGNATIAHTCTLTLVGASTVEVSGSQDYIGMKKPTLTESNTSAFIQSSENIFVKYVSSYSFTVWEQSDVVYFEITPHRHNSQNEDTLNKFYINSFGGQIVREINSEGDNSNAAKLKDLLNNFLMPTEVYDFYINFVDIFGHITTGQKISDTRFSSSYYLTYTNNNGDKFIRVKQVGPLKGIRPVLTYSGNLPTSYIAAFISYRKFEKTNKLYGLLYDNAKFTNGVINYADNPDIGINRKKNFFSNTNLSNPVFNAYRNNKKPSSFGSVRNKYTYIGKQVNVSDTTIFNYDIVPGLIVANDAVADNVGKESYLWMAQDSTLNNGGHTPNLAVYSTEGASSLTGRLYSGKNNIIVPTSLIIINDGTGIDNIDNGTGYNGFLAFDSTIIYSKRGFVLNVTDGRIRNLTGDKIISNKNPETGGGTSLDDTDPYMCYIYPYIWDYPLHVRRFKNAPRVSTIIPGEDVSDTVNIEHIVQTLVEPKDSIDLFQYPHPNKSELGSYKTVIAYDETMLNVTDYKKTIRRSNVLGDETEEIAWRKFPVEGYKNITENKGIITNILGIGYYFFAHTEHSLFMFDIQAAIKTEDKDIQMYQPDVFEVEYQEVFTSDKGYGGLQDDKAWVCGEFGYIFYSNDFNRFYKFDNNKLEYIDSTIINYLSKEKPTGVRFGIDKNNSRLIIKLNDGADKVISYDYELNSFISWHNYNFTEAFNTKTTVYFLWNDNGTTKIAQYNTDNFGKYVNNASSSAIPYGVLENNAYNCGIDIIVNTDYDILKMLEFITYDCRKELESWDVIEQNNQIKQDRHLRFHPFSGNTLRIYNEDCDSNVMNIFVDASTFNKLSNYKKPWYELSRWNFNYFRDDITAHPTTKTSDKLRRLFGKYIIFRFVFTNDDKKIEFENLDCRFSLNR